MKSIKSLLLLVCVSQLISCNGKKDNRIEIDNVVKQESKLTVGYNENLETLALIYNLSESGDYHFNEIVGPRATLARELTNQFASFREHEAVVKLNQLLNDGLVDMYDITLSLYHTSLPEFKQITKYPSVYYENEGLTAEETQARFDDFNQSVIKFYRDTKLHEKLVNDYKELFDKLMEEVDKVKPAAGFIKEAEAYYGVKRNAYEIIVSAFSFNGIGKAILIESNEWSKAYSLVTSNHLKESDTIDLNNLNAFIFGYNDKNYFREIGLHELIHTFLHQALKENKGNIALINEMEYMFTDSLKKDMKNQGYIDWRSCFEEHLVRIGEIKISERLGDHTFVSQYKDECINQRGFIYFHQIYALLRQYESNRTKYREIDDFIPVLLEQLSKEIPGKDSSD